MSMRGISAAVIAAALLWAAPAAAQGKRPLVDVQAAARVHGEEGLRFFEAGKWAEAYAAFERGDQLFHAPTLLMFMAQCRRNEGRLLDAKALYARVIGEPVPPGAPEQFRKAQATAATELEALHKRIPRVSATITGPGAERARVTVDGAAVSAAELAGGKDLDPGPHTLTVEADGVQPARASVVLKEGESSRVDLALVASAAPAEPKDERSRGSLLPAGIAFGVGGAGVVVGAVSGVLALGKIKDAQAGCGAPDAGGTRHCPAGNEAAASSARAARAASVVGFAVGGAGVVTGAVLAILRPGGAKAPEKTGFDVDVGPGFLGIHGRF